MKKLIESIKEGSEIKIKGNVYKTKAKSLYVTQDNSSDYYAKIFFDDHYVLVISSADDFAYFGKDIGSIGINPPFEDQIEYNSEKFKKIVTDYQIVREHCFGSILDTEGEVLFWDFENIENEDHLLSLAINSRTQKRADVDATVISEEEIIVL